MDGAEGITLTQVLSIAGPGKLTILTTGQWATFIAGVPEYIYKSITHPDTGSQHPVYSSNTFNEYGDHVSHYNMPREKKITVSRGEETINHKWCRYLSETIKSLENRGVRVLLIPPVTIQSNHDLYIDRLKTIYDIMDNDGTPFAVAAETHALPDTLAFDTPYHMTKQGATIFTELVIEELRPFFH